jgi:RHS repeat-associated protein
MLPTAPGLTCCALTPLYPPAIGSDPRVTATAPDVCVRGTQPCKVRKDGAPSVVVISAKTKGGPPAGSTAYVYDAENRLIATGGFSYLYDGDGQRVEKCTEGTTPGSCASGATGTLYWRGTNSDPLTETDLLGNVLNTYIFFNGQRIARRDSTGTDHYYFSDHLGSHGVVENATGSTCEQDMDYYPYGGVENDYCPNVAQNYKFTGKEHDSESGLDYFGFRHYGSSLGRFMKPDEPFADQDEANPQSWNLYSYVRNNPLRYTDPTGNACVSDGNEGWKDDNSGGETCAQVNAADQNAQPSVTVTATAPNVALAAGAATLGLGWESGPPDWAVGLGLLGLGCVQTHCWMPIVNFFSQSGNAPPPASAPSTSQTATPNPDNGGGRKWKFGSNKSEQQWRSQLARRGWTPEQIDEAIANGQKFPAQNNINPSNGATRFVDPTTGRSVVLDNVTNEVIHVGGDGFRY